VLNPPPDQTGAYPRATIEPLVPWWGSFLAKARPGAAHEPAAAELMGRIFMNALAYVKNGYASGVLSSTPPLTPR
jgi:hypothetical protein